MSVENYRWLLTRLPDFKEKKLIDSQAEENLRSYCGKMIEELSAAQNVPQKKESVRAKPKRNINWVPVILMTVSCVLVAGGLISLIAYNWAFISRTVKIIAALLIMLGTQAAVLVCTLNGKMKKSPVREGFGLGWAIMFGAVIAFVSQILRLPSNVSAFIFVWALSSVLVLYATKSDVVFFFTMILGTAFICATKCYEDSSSLIYLLFAALVPYAFIRKNNVLRWSLVVYAVAMLGFCLDKSVPGLWIVAYTSLFAIFAMSKNKEMSIIFSSALGLMLILLCMDYFWTDIGWHFLRKSPSHHLDGSILDVVLSAGLFIFCIALALFKTFVKKERSIRNLVAAVPFVITALYFVYSILPEKINGYSVAPCVLILMGFIVTAVLALAFRTQVYLAALFLIPFQFILAPLFNPLAFCFCYLVFILAVISIRTRHFKIKVAPVVFRLLRIALLILFLVLTICSIPSGLDEIPNLKQNEYPCMVLYSLVSVFSLLALILSLGEDGLAESIDLIFFPLCGFVLSILLNHVAKDSLIAPVQCALIALSILGLYSLQIRKDGTMSTYVFCLVILLFPIESQVTDAIFLVISMAAWCFCLRSLYGGIAMGVLAAIVGAISLLLTAFMVDINWLFRHHLSVMSVVSFFSVLVLFILSGILSLVEIVRTKKWINPVLFVHPLLIAVTFCIKPLTLYGPQNVLSSVCFVLLVLFCIYYLIRASVISSLAMANCATVFLGIVVMVKFFVEDYSLIAKGLVFIALGVGVFLINIFLSRRGKNAKKDSE